MMTPRISSWLLGLCLATSSMGISEEEAAKKAEAPSFRGEILGMKLTSGPLGIVLDVSESMNRSMPWIQQTLREKTPRNPVLHVDGCGIERPDPRPRIINGVAPETITAIRMLAEHSTANSILWITDMGDPPNRDGIESLRKVLAEHELQLFLISLKNKPSPSIRKAIEETEGYWELIDPKAQK